MSTEEAQQSMPNSKRRTTPRRSSSSDGVITMAESQRGGGGGGEEDRGNSRDASIDAFAATKRMILSLRSEMNGMEVRHKEELYWLKLELDTTRREKEAVDERIESLYREMQELEAIPAQSSAKPGSGKLPPGRAVEATAQVQKYEKMMRVMNNQIVLLRNSSDKLLKSLKDEISSLIDEKGRAELALMNQLSDLEKENRELKVRVQIAEQGQQLPPSKPKDVHQIPSARLASATGDAAASNPSETRKLKDEVMVLKQQNQKKDQELAQSQASLVKLGDECEELTKVVNELKREVQVVWSSEATQRALDQIRKQQDESKLLLERVAETWDQADETVQSLTPLMEKLVPTRSDDLQKSGSTDDQDRMLSVLETASLVNGQAKVSLMLVELKLRNSLGCIWNDRSHLQPFNGGDDGGASAFEARLSAAQAEAMAAIEKVKGAVNAQFARLEAQSEEVTATLTESIESRIGELQRMQSRQSELQQMLTNLRESDEAETREVVNADGSVDMFVSRKVLERLQSEVLMIVDRVQEKNEEIVRLQATVDELKVRERAFMDELRRMMQEQSRIEMEERNRRMLAQAQHDLENDEEDDVTDSDYDDCSSSAYEPSGDEVDDEDDLVEEGEEEEESYLEETVAD